MAANESIPCLRRSRRSKQAKERLAANAERRASLRNRSQRCIIRVVEHVASTRGVDWNAILCMERGCSQISAARVLAMALCAALDVPQFLIARAFSRSWATVYYAEVRCSTLYRQDPAFRKEWDSLITACGEPAH